MGRSQSWHLYVVVFLFLPFFLLQTVQSCCTNQPAGLLPRLIGKCCSVSRAAGWSDWCQGPYWTLLVTGAAWGLLQEWHETVHVLTFFFCQGSPVCIGWSCSQLPCPRGRRMPASTISLCDVQSHGRTTAGQHGPPLPCTCCTPLWSVALSLSPQPPGARLLRLSTATAVSSWMVVNAVIAHLSIHLMASIELSSWIAFVSPFLTFSFIAAGRPRWFNHTVPHAPKPLSHKSLKSWGEVQ